MIAFVLQGSIRSNISYPSSVRFDFWHIYQVLHVLIFQTVLQYLYGLTCLSHSILGWSSTSILTTMYFSLVISLHYTIQTLHVLNFQVPFGPMQKCFWGRRLSWCVHDELVLWRHKNCWFVSLASFDRLLCDTKVTTSCSFNFAIYLPFLWCFVKYVQLLKLCLQMAPKIHGVMPPSRNHRKTVSLPKLFMVFIVP